MRSLRAAIGGMTASLLVAGSLTLASPAIAADPADNPTGEALGDLVDVAQWYDDVPGITRYRIPALTQLNNGDLLAVFDFRPKMDDLPSNIGVAMRRSIDGGKTWGPIQTIHYEQAPKGEGDPSVLVERTTGKIFVFYAGSVNRGYGSSAPGNSEDDPNTMTVHYSWSDDNGNTWQQERITEQVKDASWAGIFAASGEGIQVRSGQYAGRLVQQFVAKVEGKNHNVSLYSDDLGETWQFGEPANPTGGSGWGDENKVAELSDGTLMMNTRIGPRGVMLSHDGGQSWDYDTYYQDWQQIDPYSNGAISRIYPDAPADSAEAKMPLLVNSEDFDIRHNDTAKVSCDDGKTWPGRIQIYEGASAYITPTPIKEDGEYRGKMGLLFERDGYTKLTYTTLDTKAMGMVCAPVGVKDDRGSNPSNRIALDAGTQAEVSFTITNQTSADLPAGGTITVSGDYGWDQETNHADVPQVAAGQTLEVPVSVGVPATVAGNRMLTVTYTDADGNQSQQYVYVNVNRNGQAAHIDADVEAYIDAVYTDNTPGPLGDGAVPWVRLTNTGNATARLEVDDGGQSTMKAYCKATLAAGESTTCKRRASHNASANNQHAINQADIDAGVWQPTFTLKYGESPSSLTQTKTIQLDPLDLNVDADNSALIQTLDTSGGSPVYLPTGDFKSSAMFRVNDTQINSWRIPDGYPLSLNAAKNNRTSAQLVVNPPKAGTLTAEVSSDENISWEVTYPERIKRFTGSKYSNDLREAGVTTDPLRTEAPQVEADQNQAIWFVAHVGPEAPAGVTTQTITLKLDGEVIGTYPVHTVVYDKQLIDVNNRPFTLDLWWHPDAIADYYNVPVWSDEHFALMKPYLEELAEARQDVVNIVVNQDPWYLPNLGKPQTESHYNAAVKWSWDGERYSFDFTNFDKLLAAHEEAGIDGPIHIFSLLNFRQQERLTYFDETQGKEVTRNIELGGADYNQAWGQFLRALEDHLNDSGDFDRATLMFDEQPAAVMNKMLNMLKTEAPNWQDKIALAANSLNEADLANFIAFNRDFLNSVPDELISQRREDGKTSLYYTWSQPVNPNIVTESPLVSTRVLGWIVEQKNLDGFLRWTFNSWPANVFENPTYMYSQGDEYIVYPGGTKADPKVVSSMRWEAFQDGIDDAEILREAKNTVGVDEGEIARIFSTIKHDGGNTPQSWASMVNGRTAALRLIGEQKDSEPRLVATPEASEVAPGSPVKIKVKVSAPRTTALQDVVLKASAPDDWQISPASLEVGNLAAGRTRTLEFWVANNYGEGEGTIEFTASFAGGELSTSVDLTAVDPDPCQPVKFSEPSANSQETVQEDNKIENAFDGDPNTLWHTGWNDQNGKPATVTVKTDAAVGQELCSFSYLMRQSGNNDNGKVRDFTVSVSEDGKTWSEPVLTAEAKNDRALQTWDLPEGTTGPWIKIHVTSNYSNNPFIGAAEFGVDKKLEVNREVTFVDSVDLDSEDLAATREFTIPNTGITYVVDGEIVEPGKHEAAAGDIVAVTMNGLADHGYELPEGTAPDWQHTFLKLEVPAQIAVAPESEIPEGAAASLTANNGGKVTYALYGAPDWLSIDPQTGALSGTAPAEETEFSVVVSATEVVADDAPAPAALGSSTVIAPGTFTAAAKLEIKVEAPTEPTDPIEPTDPSETGEPTEPSQTEPTTAPTTEPSVTEPSETEPSQTEPSETEPPVTEPSETQPSEPGEPTEPSEPTESGEPTDPSESEEPTDPSESGEPTSDGEPTEQPSEPSDEPTTAPSETSGSTGGSIGLPKTGVQVGLLALAALALAGLGVGAVRTARNR